MPDTIIKKLSQAEINKGEFQSCRYCPIGAGEYEVKSDEDTYYVCEKHKKEHKL